MSMRRFCWHGSLYGRSSQFGAAIALVASLMWVWGTLMPGTAFAREPMPLEVKAFTLFASEAVSVSPPLTHENWGYKNEQTPFTQAGGHPNAVTSDIEFETEEIPDTFLKKGFLTAPTRDPKDVVVDLPPGLVGDPLAVPRCPLKRALSVVNPCPAATQVGIAKVQLNGKSGFIGPIVNVVPERGQSAEFAIETGGKVSAVITGRLVRVSNLVTGQREYGLDVESHGIVAGVYNAETTFWGVPAARIHDPLRGMFCEQGAGNGEDPWACRGGGESAGVEPMPFLTWPSDCAAGPEQALLRADSWEEPGRYTTAKALLPGVTGCDLLQFKAGTELKIAPNSLLADEPTGLDVSLDIPPSESPETNAAPLLRDTVVTLPEGMSISPGAVNGVKACDVEGPEGINIDGPYSEAPGPSGESQLAPGRCPPQSIVGSAEAITPLLPQPVKGHVYLARPGCGGALPACTEHDAADGNLYKLYLELGGEGALSDEGIVFKVPFSVEANPATGQLTTDVKDLVQAPYSSVVIRLNGDARASLANPATCGPAVSSARLTPWSAPGTSPEGQSVAGTPDLASSTYFEVQGCSSPVQLKPGFLAGTVTPNAGKFSTFTMNLSRRDREQYVKGIQLHAPPGLLARLAGVPLCPEAQANEPARSGMCSAASKIGTVRVATGAGEGPFEVEGDVYLTGPYRGAPFGLSIVTRAVAGPFDLGLVVVRARIDIERKDSTALITADETGPYAIPQMLFGIPLRLRRITVNVDRPGFMLNPTNCSAMHVDALVAGSGQALAPVSSPFAVGGCRSLAFKPTFTAQTNAHTSRKLGASLDTRLSYPKGAMGADANIAQVKVSLPRQLPSYLATLQKACPAATFERDPAQCPPASVVGMAKTRTPLLAHELEGPVYFVSHGGEAFPSLIVVLQGDGGIRVDLTGATSIRKGITSSTFKTVPDVPVQSFELYLPQRKDHALSANGNLCNAKSASARTRQHASGLFMPTEFVAQNGVVIRQQTRIAVTGCPDKTKRGARAHGKHGHQGRQAK